MTNEEIDRFLAERCGYSVPLEGKMTEEPWIKVETEYGGTLYPHIFACEKCGTVAMESVRDDCPVCLLLDKVAST